MAKKKPGKYDAVIGKLANLPVEDQSYQAKVQAVKDSLQKFPTSPSSLGREYARLRAEHERVEKETYEINLRIEAVSQLLIETNEAENAEWGAYGAPDTTLRLVNGDSIRVQKEPIGQVTDKEAFRQWCLANGYANQLQLWPSTMNALVKERLLVGQPEPDGTEVFVKTKLVYTPLKVGDD